MRARRFVQAGAITLAFDRLLEYELVDIGDGAAHALALTLLRATGMLSRGPMTTRPLPAGPEIELDGKTEIGTEGCLSFPEITGQIERAKLTTARAQTLEGGTIEVEASGFLARAIQHEGDHLNGILFIDRMNSAAKAALASRLKRLQKETRRGIRHRETLVTETTL